MIDGADYDVRYGVESGPDCKKLCKQAGNCEAVEFAKQSKKCELYATVPVAVSRDSSTCKKSFCKVWERKPAPATGSSISADSAASPLGSAAIAVGCVAVVALAAAVAWRRSSKAKVDLEWEDESKAPAETAV